MIGTSLGPYRIVEALGAGGMGEVYLAEDTRLGRKVAVKVLPPQFASDPERLARFEQEARAAAALNHPHIATVHDVGSHAGTHFIVQEYLRGQTLRDALQRGALPLARTLQMGIEIGEALAAAHRAGIVHRDLKPENVFVSDDGHAKVLDFDLAKLTEARHSGADLSMSPTVVGTQAGVLMGTAGYMAPEQVRGEEVDARADLFALGCVLFEMATGQRTFRGQSVHGVLDSILSSGPVSLAALGHAPAELRRIAGKCLAKDAARRYQGAADLVVDLRNLAADVEAGRTGAGGEAVPETTGAAPAAWRWAAVFPWLAVAAALALAAWALSARPPGQLARAIAGHLTIELPADAALVTNAEPARSEGPVAISPDGRSVVYVAPSGPTTHLVVRALNDFTPQALAGTEGARLPFFSTDGESIGFFADGKLRKALLSGGTPATLADAPNPLGASWGGNGDIVFAPDNDGLFMVPAAGGTPRRVTTLDSAAGDDMHAWPQIVGDGRAALFTVVSYSRETSEIALVDLDTGERHLVQEDAAFARYMPAADGSAGHLVFVRGEALMAAPFDPARAEPAGAPIAVTDGVRPSQFAVSGTGVLVYAPGRSAAPDYSLVWVDRAGTVTLITDLPRGYEDLHLSPDGRRVALTIEEAGPDSPAHVWIADTVQGTLSRLTAEGFNRDPVWAPDGRSVVFGSKRGESTFGLYVQPIDGSASAELVWASPVAIWPDPQSWTPDGRAVVFTTKGADTRDDIWTLSLDDGTAQPWLSTPGAEWGGRLSPDGEWMAFNELESGRNQVYVQPYPGPGVKRLVSEGGGVNPIWSRDGRELFYRRDDEMVVVEVDTSDAFSVGRPTVLFSGRFRLTGRDYDVSPDGTRFVMMLVNEPRTTGSMRVLLNWWQTLEARLAGTR